MSYKINDYKEALKRVTENGLSLKGVEEEIVTPELIELAIKSNPRAIEFVRNPSQEQCLLAVQMNPHAISHIKNPAERVCLEAVKGNGLVLNYISNQTIQICEEAIQQNPQAVRFIRPFMYRKELFYMGVKRDWRLLEFVPKDLRDLEMCMLAFGQSELAQKYFEF